jgi:regulator of RNase E activity RraB
LLFYAEDTSRLLCDDLVTVRMMEVGWLLDASRAEKILVAEKGAQTFETWLQYAEDGWHETAKDQTKRQTTNSNTDPDDGRVASFSERATVSTWTRFTKERVHNICEMT